MINIYELDLNPLPFERISQGLKTIEMRLNKNGRDNISNGDFIIFKNNKSGEKIKVIVTSVSKFSSFEELYKSYPKNRLGYRNDEKADPRDMLAYYKEEDIRKYGVLAIEIKLVK